MSYTLFLSYVLFATLYVNIDDSYCKMYGKHPICKREGVT